MPTSYEGTRSWARWINIVLGVWLIVSPWVLGYLDDAARANDFWVGIAIVALAAGAMAVGWLRFLNTALGVWLVLAPWLLGYITAEARANDVIVGLLVIAASLVPNYARRRTPVAGRPAAGTA